MQKQCICTMATVIHSILSVSHLYCDSSCSLHGRLVLTANVIAEGARKVCYAMPAIQASMSYDITGSEISRRSVITIAKLI